MMISGMSSLAGVDFQGSGNTNVSGLDGSSNSLGLGDINFNPSGGLKSKGHPIGATGVSMHVMAAMQLSGEAEGMQIENAIKGAVFNMGGAAVTNYVSILETS